MAKTPGKRAFWLHQFAEYVLGIAFVSQGLQSPTPVVPTALGGLIVLNTACARGPLSAFRIFGRASHRILDAVLIAITVVAVAQPWIHIESTTRFIMGLLAFVLAFVWWQSDFSASTRELRRAAAARQAASAAAGPAVPRGPSAPDGSIPDTFGRKAGHLAGVGVSAYRARKAKREAANGG